MLIEEIDCAQCLSKNMKIGCGVFQHRVYLSMVFFLSVMRLRVRLFGVSTRVKSNNGAEVQMCLLKLLLT